MERGIEGEYESARENYRPKKSPGKRHILVSDLHPTPRCRTQINANAGILKKTEFSIQLNEFEGCSRTVASFFRKFVKLVLARLSGLDLFTHVCQVSVTIL